MSTPTLAAILLALAACGNAEGGPETRAPGAGATAGAKAAATTPPASAPAVPPQVSAAPADGEACLGVADKGIWSDLDEGVQLALPAALDPARVTATVDDERRVLVLAIDGWPVKPYPLGGDATLQVGDRALALRAGDRAELAPLLAPGRVTAGKARPDRDADGIPDSLDVLIGARKTVLNADAYVSGYHKLAYPMGDVPRTIGVCTDVIIRSLRNAGLDLQVELQRDLRRAPRAYPMVQRAGDANIDHRRVKTLLPYFQRNLERHAAALDDAADPLRPGDIVLFDTFPTRVGPDHIGIVSDRAGDSGLPLVINNWTDGTVTTEMDLLGWVPVTHRFRIR